MTLEPLARQPLPYSVSFISYTCSQRYEVDFVVYSIRALVVIDWHDKYLEEFWKVMPAEIASGNIKCVEHICNSLQEAGRGFVDMMEGRNVGKTVVVLSEE